MNDLEVHTAAETAPAAPGLTQWQRVTNVFSAPSKTFEDIKRGNRSWWMPLIVASLAGYILFTAITLKIGWPQVVDNIMRMDPKTEEKLAQMPPEQRAAANKISIYSTEGSMIALPAMILAVVALGSLGLWATINFVFGGKATYGAVFAVWMFATLPDIIKSLLGAIVLFAGGTPESFNLKNAAPTNLGAFLNPAETSKALYTFATSLDAVSIWSMILLGIGVATVAGVKRTSGYIAVFGWWALFLLISLGWAAMSS